MNELNLETIKADIDEVKNDLTKEKNVRLFVLRLDKIHLVVSGNKLFKLHYYLKDAINSTHKKIITFGGAYSNHLAAAAFAGKQNGLKTIAIVRGEKPAILSHTLQFCIEQGMQLEFISRSDYAKKEDESFLNTLHQKFGEHILIPEGGFGEQGVKGAALITKYFKKENYTHICSAVGTATTFAGLLNSAEKDQKLLAFSALKNLNDFDKRLKQLSVNTSGKNYELISDYHFGGYAKYTIELISFMNNFFDQQHIPLDFVYTAKMMFGVNDLIKKNYFLPGSRILCIHTGGLQGNLSLPKNVLNF